MDWARRLDLDPTLEARDGAKLQSVVLTDIAYAYYIHAGIRYVWNNEKKINKP